MNFNRYAKGFPFPQPQLTEVNTIIYTTIYTIIIHTIIIIITVIATTPYSTILILMQHH